MALFVPMFFTAVCSSNALLVGTSLEKRQSKPVIARPSSSRGNTRKWFSKKEFDGGDDDDSFTPQTRNPLRLLVLRLGLTEPRATSSFNYGKYDGKFTCGYCDETLFDSNSKYDSGSGWPSFWRTDTEGAVQYKMEMDGRLECQCGRCSR